MLNWHIFSKIIRLTPNPNPMIFHHDESTTWGKEEHFHVCGILIDLIHWGRVTHISVSKLTIIGSDSGLSSGRRQAIIWTNAGILLMGPLGTNFSEIWSEIHSFSFTNMHLKVSSAKWRQCINRATLYIHIMLRLAHFISTAVQIRSQWEVT